MTMTQSDLAEIHERLLPLLGEPVRQVWAGRWNAATIRFEGGWRLRISGDCAWRAEQGCLLLAGRGDEAALCREALHRLVGLGLRSVELALPALETTLQFDEHFVLHLFPVRSEERGPWRLYSPQGYVLAIGPGSQWCYTAFR
jgi:hypothetical protein